MFDKKLEINLKTIIIAAAAAVGVFFVWRLSGVLFIILISYLISAVMRPLFAFFRRKLPLNASILASYLFLAAIIIGAGSLIFPPLISETSKFVSRFPDYFDRLTSEWNVDTTVFNRNFEEIGSNLVQVIMSVVSNTIEFLTILVISVYIAFERRNFLSYFVKFFGEEKGRRIEEVLEKAELRLAVWLKAQVLLCLIIGVATYVGLTALRFPYAIPLAVMAGALEAVPNIGPIVSSIPAVIIGFSENPLQGVIAMALYFLIQQLENHLLVPRIMGRASGLPPLAVIIVLLIGGSLFGVVGIILAIPVFLIGQTVAQELLPNK